MYIRKCFLSKLFFSYLFVPVGTLILYLMHSELLPLLYHLLTCIMVLGFLNFFYCIDCEGRFTYCLISVTLHFITEEQNKTVLGLK